MKSLRSTLSASPENPFESEEQNKGKKRGVRGNRKRRRKGGLEAVVVVFVCEE
jgi:hypothetical protein